MTNPAKNEVTYKKLMAVTSSKDDIIFMSDLRLNSKKNKTIVHDVEKICFGLGYNSHLYSTLPSCSVGILIKREIDCTIKNSIYDTVSDNFILLSIQIGKCNLTIGSI